MDTVSEKKRSWIMAQVKSTGARSTEERFRALLREHHITGWRRNYPLLGKPDFVFPKARIAIFVDGCFWHGHPKRCRMPEANREYWKKKIQRNIARDKTVNRSLREKGWKVLRIWEHMVVEAPTLRRLMKAISSDEK
jgi:DNA mismatch endonuclease (patch repair protein)